jgi:uncharacterized membrane protein
MESIPWMLGGIAAAGIIHILCVFAMPIFAENDAWARLSAKMTTNMLVPDTAKEGPILPFTPQDVVSAYCLFDLSSNNVIVKSPLPERTWSLTLSSRSGENFYVLTGADAKKPSVRLLILRQDRLPEEASTEKTEEGDEQNILVSPSETGIVAIRAPLRGESFRKTVMDELKKARCEIQKVPEAVAIATEPVPATPGGRDDRRKRPARGRGR